MLDLGVNLGGIAYGLVLVAATFFRSRMTEAMRIDALIVPSPGESTRMLNLVIGLALVGYNGYSLIR